MVFVKVVEGSEIYDFPVHHFVHFYSNFWSFRRSNRGAVTQGWAGRRRVAPAPRLPRRLGRAPTEVPRLPKMSHALRATLEVRTATWSFRVRRRSHPRLTPGPSAPSPCRARRPRSWTPRPPRQPWAHTGEAVAPINWVGARWPKGDDTSPRAMSAGAAKLPPPRVSAVD
jgi:hypothetical protein